MQLKAGETVVSMRHSDAELVTRVTSRIIAVLPQPGSVRGYVGHLTRCEWTCTIIDSPIVNAVVAPGGKIVVYTGTRLSI